MWNYNLKKVKSQNAVLFSLFQSYVLIRLNYCVSNAKMHLTTYCQTVLSEGWVFFWVFFLGGGGLDGGKWHGNLWLTLTAGRKVKKLYFWLLMTFLGYLCSLFSGWPSHTVRGRKSPIPQHLDQGQHLRKRQEKFLLSIFLVTVIILRHSLYKGKIEK